jgi:hypothetical protein
MPKAPKAILDGPIKCAQPATDFKPIGIAFHAGATDVHRRPGKIALISTLSLAKISSHAVSES